MKNISRIIGGLLFVMLLCTATSSRAQYWLDDCGGTGKIGGETNSGTEFLLCYMQNELPTYVDINATYQDLYLAALDEVDPNTNNVTITITCRAFPQFNEVIQLPRRGSLTYHIDKILKQFVLIESNEIVDDKVIKVVSSHPIVCYGMNHKLYSADAFIAYPKGKSQTDYMVMSYQNSQFTQDGGGRQSEFCVAAFEDSTLVEIIPACQTRGGSPAGQVLTFTLDAGQCVQVQAGDLPLTNDLTGSRVNSFGKSVVVYGGHIRAEIPAGFKYPSSESTSRDHLCEAIPPTTTWGTNFVCNSFNNSNVTDGDLVRVLARTNNTVVKVNGVAWGTPLASGEYRDMLIKTPTAIETSEFSLVGMYAHTTMVNNGFGDPFFAIIPPLNQTYDDFTFFVSQDAVYTDNYVLIVTEKSGIGKIDIDGVLLPTIAFQSVPTTLGGKSFAVATVNVLPGSHRIKTTNQTANGITILTYGFGNVDSYGYTAGSLLKPLQGIVADDNVFAGVAPGETPRSEIRFLSIMNRKVWLDSAVVTEISNPRYSVRTKKSLPYDISYLTGGQKMAVELEVFPPTNEVLYGTMQVHHHTTEWRGMRPATVPFVIYPQHQASVNTDEYSDRSVTVYPNPVVGDKGSVTLRVDRSTTAVIRLFDATGREVLSLPARQINSREETLNFSTRGLTSGSYVLELSMPELNRTERRHIIIQK